MKSFIFITLITLFILPLFAFAITPGYIPSAGDLGVQPSPINEPSGLLAVVAGVVVYVYVIFFIIAIMFILFSAYGFLAGADAPDTIKKARKQLIYAAIAIIIALLAVGVQAIVRNFLVNPRSGTQYIQNPTNPTIPTPSNPEPTVPTIQT